MTTDTLNKANELQRLINNNQEKLALVQDMQVSKGSISLYSSTIGSVHIPTAVQYMVCDVLLEYITDTINELTEQFNNL